MDVVTVVIPTVSGREDHLERCVEAYRTRTRRDTEILVYHDRPTCGIVWQLGASEAQGDFIHLTADDLEPQHWWDDAAVATVRDGYVPAPVIHDPHGAAQSLPAWGVEPADWTPVEMSTVPFMSREQWRRIDPLFTGHYYTDNFFSDRARAAGWAPMIRTGYAFTHHWAQPGRGAGTTADLRMKRDEADYREALRMIGRGEWSSPWPN